MLGRDRPSLGRRCSILRAMSWAVSQTFCRIWMGLCLWCIEVGFWLYTFSDNPTSFNRFAGALNGLCLVALILCVAVGTIESHRMCRD